MDGFLDNPFQTPSPLCDETEPKVWAHMIFCNRSNPKTEKRTWRQSWSHVGQKESLDVFKDRLWPISGSQLPVCFHLGRQVCLSHSVPIFVLREQKAEIFRLKMVRSEALLDIQGFTDPESVACFWLTGLVFLDGRRRAYSFQSLQWITSSHRTPVFTVVRSNATFFLWSGVQNGKLCCLVWTFCVCFCLLELRH